MHPLEIIKAYKDAIKEQTSTQAVIIPCELKSDKFFISLSLLPHPIIFGNGRIRLRLRAMVETAVAASDKAIDECLTRSIRLARFFGEAQGFPIIQGVSYGMAYHTPLREDDDLFADLSEERGFVYAESWLTEIEFDENILFEN